MSFTTRRGFIRKGAEDPAPVEAPTIHDLYAAAALAGLLAQGERTHQARTYAKAAHHLAAEMVKERRRILGGAP